MLSLLRTVNKDVAVIQVHANKRRRRSRQARQLVSRRLRSKVGYCYVFLRIPTMCGGNPHRNIIFMGWYANGRAATLKMW